MQDQKLQKRLTKYQVLKNWRHHTSIRQIARYKAFKKVRARLNKKLMFESLEALVRYRERRSAERRIVEAIRVSKVQRVKAHMFRELLTRCFQIYRQRQSDEVQAITVSLVNVNQNYNLVKARATLDDTLVPQVVLILRLKMRFF